MDDCIEELTYENFYLKAELSLHKEYQHALLNLKSKVTFAFEIMEEILNEANERLRKADQNYRELYGIRDQKESCGQYI